MSNGKEVVYVDIDDEITAIIDKVQSSKEKIVALVLPKRAAVLQSIVNMKLLKRSAENAKKHVVLITSETGLLPLAGVVGIHVAATLQSRPTIPTAAEGISTETDIDESADFDPDAESSTPVGELAGGAAVPVAASDDLETIELDNEDPAASGITRPSAFGAAVTGASSTSNAKKSGKLKIPDFNKFRLGLILGGTVLVALLVFGYFAMFVMPKATITIGTDSSDITTSATITLDPSINELDLDARLFPAKIETKQQTGTQQTVASGQKNKGNKATGTVTLALEDCSEDEVTVPAGTGVSSGGQTFITQDSATMESVKVGSKCSNSSFTNISTQEVDVVALNPGAAGNIGPSDFAVASFSMVSGESKNPMTGGTDNIVKVVSQQDIDSAKQKISTDDTRSVNEELADRLRDAGYIAIENSMNSGEPVVKASANPGDETDTVTVTSTTAYTMYGLKRSDVEAFVVANVEDKIDKSKQQVLDKGLSNASYDVANLASSGKLQVAFTATSLAGPDLDAESLKRQVAGKKTNDVRTIVRSTPGVTDVSVKYSPFWVSKVPTKESKITIVIEKAPATTSDASSDE